MIFKFRDFFERQSLEKFLKVIWNYELFYEFEV